MTTVNDLRNKKLSDITPSDLQKLVVSDSDEVSIKRCRFTAYINGGTMGFCPVGEWQFTLGRMPTYIFHFARFSDMPKSLQDLWKQKTGDTEPELKIK